MAVQIEQPTDVKRYRITLDEFDRMIEAGVFDPDARIELIRGEIVEMPPISDGHMSRVARITLLFTESADRKALVWPQGNAVRLVISQSRPQPDIAILRWRDDYYARQTPQPKDVLLLVEVAESSLKYDRGVKRALYAEAGIAEYWVVNLPSGLIEVYADPNEGQYRSVRMARRGEMLPLPDPLHGSVAVDDVLG